ncbi:MAG: TRAP transporter small permease [Deltaproteobacteria bacterium]|jgi:TRAP-type C4-dicarboxylate transport system permease small subunit
MRMKAVSDKLGRISTALAYVGAFSLFGMMCLTTADVGGRYLFNAPILGAFELTEFLILILIFSFLAYTQSKKAHVSVNLLVMLFPKKLRKIIALFNYTLCLILMGLITYMGFLRALELVEFKEASPNLGVPHYPFVFFLVLGCLAMCIEYVRDLLRLFEDKEESVDS